jgi:hypothetical protein
VKKGGLLLFFAGRPVKQQSSSFSKSNIETENQRRWRTFFKTGEAPEGAPEYIRKAAWVIEKSNMTKEEREVYDQIQKAQDTYDSEIYTA